MKWLVVGPPLLLGVLAIGIVWWGTHAAGRQDAAAPWTRPLAERAGSPYPRVYVGALGERTVLPAPPVRIVSATVASDAVLLAICPRERILALHRLSRDPRYSPVARESAAFGRHVGGDPEEILALEPDLVLLSSFSREETRSLYTSRGCAVVRLPGASSLADVESNLRALGWVLGLDADAERLVAEMRAKLDRLAEGRARRRTWRVLLYAGDRTAGLGTTFDDLLRAVGARNAAAELGLEGSCRIDPEQILLADPDVLVVPCVPGEEQEAVRGIDNIELLARLRAVRDGRVVPVPAGILQSTSHHVADAAVRIARALDRFGSPERR